MGAIVKTETIGGLLVDGCSKEMSEISSNFRVATKYYKNTNWLVLFKRLSTYQLIVFEQVKATCLNIHDPSQTKGVHYRRELKVVGK